MTWICRKCETENSEETLVCDVCESEKPKEKSGVWKGEVDDDLSGKSEIKVSSFEDLKKLPIKYEDDKYRKIGKIGRVNITALMVICGIVLSLFYLNNNIRKNKDLTEKPIEKTIDDYPVPAAEVAIPEVSGKITNVYIEHNVYEGQVKGMKIHVSLKVEGRKGGTCKVMVKYCYKSGQPLRDYNNNYKTKDGDVSALADIKPLYDDTEYSDIIIFMPYDELHMVPGECDLKLYVVLIDYETGDTLSRSGDIYFHYKGPEKEIIGDEKPIQLAPSLSTVHDEEVLGEIEKITIDHNVYEDGQKGMRIHVVFTVVNRKYKKCKAIAYFSYDFGDSLKDYNGLYTTVGGDVSVGEDFIPEYDNTRFNDLILFIPYEELHLASGESELKFIVRLYDYDTKTFICSSGDYKFHFSR